MSIFMKDLRYALRVLYKNRSFTIVALIVLALGIGANSAIFSFVNAILLRSLPYSESDRLVRIYSTSPGKEVRTFTSSYPDFLDWKNNNQVFEDMGAWARGTTTATGTDNPERFDTALVTPGFFNVLGVTPERGRVFTSDDDQPGTNQVIVLSNGVWQRRFAADPNIIGKPLTLEGTSYTIIGVMPADFNFLFPVDVWMPMSLNGKPNLEDRGRHFISVLARLKRGVSLRQAQLDLQNIAARIEKEYGKTNQGWSNNAVLLYDELTGGIRGPLWVLFAAALLVLMIACLNVANLQLIRAASRAKEMAMRMAIGATRGQLIRQLLTESLVLAVIGGLLGLLLGIGGISLLKSLMPPTRIPRLNEVGLDGSLVLFTLGISLLTGVIFGLSPAFRALRPDLNETLKEGARSNTGGTSNRLRSLLVVSEIALALMLTVFAGLVIQTFKNLVNIDPGFKTENVVTMQLALPPSRYAGPPQIKDFYQRVLDNIKAQPGVVTAGATNNLPLIGGGGYLKIYLEGKQDTKPQEVMTGLQIATPDYFRTMGVPFLSGRDFTPQEDLVAIVNESTAKKFWPGENPLGKRVRFQPNGDWITVIGIVADMKALGLTSAPRTEVFLALGQDTFRTGYVIVRTNVGTEAMVPSLRAAVSAIDKDMAIFNVKTLEKLVSDSIAQPRLNMVLLGIFAGLALILASVGIYGVMSYSVTQRTQELGVRMALGAQRRDIFSLVLKQGIILALIGVGIGVAGAIGLSKVLGSLLYGISATDPVTFISVALIMIVVALVACFFPARKATKVDPLTAMRYE
jgi:putative ABC transport system permease protein